MTPQKYCRNKTGGSGSSLYYSFLFLPPPQREATTALYAFYRETAEIIDECRDPGVAQIKLAWWRQEIERMFAGLPNHPISRSLFPAIGDRGLCQDDLLTVIDGIQVDLATTHYPTLDVLIEHCHRTGSIIGLMTAAILGYSDPGTRGYARNLGMALQLADILTAVGKDARHNRVYLPQEDLQRFHVNTDDILHGRENDNFRALMAFETERVLEYIDTALQHLPDTDRSRQLPGLILAAIYVETLKAIRDGGYRVLTQTTALTPLTKLWIAWRIRWREKRRTNH
jgi:15-cis-phytoene synthase